MSCGLAVQRCGDQFGVGCKEEYWHSSQKRFITPREAFNLRDAILNKALAALRGVANGRCWCDGGIKGTPLNDNRQHSAACDAVRKLFHKGMARV